MVSSSVGLATTGIFPVFLAGALAVQMSQEFGYGTRGIGISIAGFYAASSLTSLSMGRRADRIGWARAIRISVIGCIVSLTAVGLLASSLASVVILIGVAGISNALLQPAVNLLIAKEAPFPRRGLLFGLKQGAIPLATLIGGLSVPVVALTVGWRWAFYGAAVFGVASLALLPTRDADEGDSPATRSSVESGRASRSLLPLFMVSLTGQTGASALGSFVVVSAVHTGFREGDAGLLLAGASVAGIVARVVVASAADRGLRLNLAPISALLMAGSVGLWILSIPETWATVAGTLIGFVAGWGWPGLFNLIVVDRHADAPATATATTQTGVYLGNGIGPVAFGFIAGSSFAVAWLVSGSLLMVAAGVAATSYLTERRSIA